MTLQNLYEIADRDGIDVDFFPMRDTVSISLPYGDKQYIAIDVDRIQTNIEEKVCLAHELGHCETGSFYNIFSPLDVRGKHENTADKWAVKKLIPKDELIEALNGGYTELWELTEYFDVSEDTVKKAFAIYKIILNPCG